MSVVDSSRTSLFSFRVNRGATQTFEANTGLYVSAAAAIPAVFGYEEFPLVVEIWCQELLPDYGPYKYVIQEAGGQAIVAEVYEMFTGRKV